MGGTAGPPSAAAASARCRASSPPRARRAPRRDGACSPPRRPRQRGDRALPPRLLAAWLRPVLVSAVQARAVMIGPASGPGENIEQIALRRVVREEDRAFAARVARRADLIAQAFGLAG